MKSDNYIVEDDVPLWEAINHYLEISHNAHMKYKILEILKRADNNDFFCFNEIVELEGLLKFSIRGYILKHKDYYLRDVENDVKTISDVNKYIRTQIGIRKTKSKYPKMDYEIIRKVISNSY